MNQDEYKKVEKAMIDLLDNIFLKFDSAEMEDLMNEEEEKFKNQIMMLVEDEL